MWNDIAFAFLRRFCHRHLCRRKHIFNENPVPRGGIVDEHVRDSSHELAVLNDRATRHECVQVGTTHLYKLLITLEPFVKKIIIFCRFQVYFVIQTNPLYVFFSIYT